MNELAPFQIIIIFIVLSIVAWDAYKHDYRNPMNYVRKTDNIKTKLPPDPRHSQRTNEGGELLEPESSRREIGGSGVRSGHNVRIPGSSQGNTFSDRVATGASAGGPVPYDDALLGETGAGPGWHYCTIDGIGAWRNDPKCGHGALSSPDEN